VIWQWAPGKDVAPLNQDGSAAAPLKDVTEVVDRMSDYCGAVVPSRSVVLKIGNRWRTAKTAAMGSLHGGLALVGFAAVTLI
jgi:hypothetical protein